MYFVSEKALREVSTLQYCLFVYICMHFIPLSACYVVIFYTIPIEPSSGLHVNVKCFSYSFVLYVRI